MFHMNFFCEILWVVFHGPWYGQSCIFYINLKIQELLLLGWVLCRCQSKVLANRIIEVLSPCWLTSCQSDRMADFLHWTQISLFILLASSLSVSGVWNADASWCTLRIIMCSWRTASFLMNLTLFPILLLALIPVLSDDNIFSPTHLVSVCVLHLVLCFQFYPIPLYIKLAFFRHLTVFLFSSNLTCSILLVCISHSHAMWLLRCLD